MAAALCARLMGVPGAAVQAGLDAFPGLPHRLELVRERGGVEWVNDSKATNVDSTAVGLAAFPAGRPHVVLVLGGRGKGAPYAPLRALFAGRVKALLTVGEDAPVVERGALRPRPHRAGGHAASAPSRRAAELGRRGRRGAPLPGLRLLRPVQELRGAGRGLPAAGGRAPVSLRATADGREPRAPAAGVDGLLLAVILLLCGLGVVMVYSASAVTAAARHGSSFHYLARQLVAAVLGLGLLSLALRLGYRRAERFAYPLLAVTFVLLVAVLLPFVGHKAGGARRWIDLGFFSFQPAEAAKLALVVYLAHSLARKREKVSTFSIGFLPHLVVAGALMALCLAQKDLGTCVVMFAVLSAMLFAAGAKVSYLLGALLIALPLGWRAIAGTPYRRERILAWLDPFAYRRGAGYQMWESMVGIGNGGWFGQGLGQGRSKLFYLPEAHTDFIAAVVAEELGLAGPAPARPPLRRAGVARAPGRLPGAGRLRLLPGPRPHHAAGRPGARQPGGGHGAAAHQGAHPALRLLRRHLAPHPARRERAPPRRVGRPGRLPAPPGAGGAGERRGAGGVAVRVLVAGGGTGGHVFPGISIAEEVVTRHPANDAVFVGTARGLEARVVPAAGYPIELIEVRGLKGKGLLGVLSGLLLLPRALLQCFSILRRWSPDVVVGVGGYASGPLVLAAWLLRIPTALQEQNAVAGVTNRILGLFVRAAFTAFPEAGRYFAARKVHQLGNPIRKELMANYMRPSAAHDRLRLLVFGGSQGAHALNMRLVEALPFLADLRGKLEITHQTGARDREVVEQGYRAVGFAPDVREFITDMSDAYAHADLVVCRAGATTLAELTVCKKPSVLVPFPRAADNHQVMNARSLVEAGAAVMIEERDLSGEVLAREIRSILVHPERREAMARAAGRLGSPQAAQEIADVCTDLVRRRWGSPRGQDRGPGFAPVRPASPPAP